MYRLPTLRRRTVAALVLSAALAGAGAVVAAPAVADTTPLLITGELHFGNASITQTCDDAGHVTSSKLSVDYDASKLTTRVVSVVASHSTESAKFDIFGSPQPMDNPGGAVRAGTSGTLTQTVGSGPAGSLPFIDIFDVIVRNATFPSVNDGVVTISAQHACADGQTTTVTHELTGPTASVSAPTCDGAVDVTLDNPTDLTWTPRVGLRERNIVAEPALAPHSHTVLHLDLDNVRASILNLTFRVTRPDTGWRQEDTDGGIYGLELPSAADCAATARGAITPVAATRLVDTRSGVGAPKAALAARARTVVQVGGRAGVPADAEAAVVTLTGVATKAGYLQAWSATDGPTSASVLNLAPGHAIANTVVVPLDVHGRFSVGNASAGATQLIVDVTGFALGSAAASGAGDLVPMDPTRLFDSRTTGSKLPVAAGATVRVPVTGRAGIASTAAAVAARVAVTGSTKVGFVNVWPGTGTEPGTSSFGFTAGQTIGSLTETAVAENGTIAVTNHSSGTVHVIVDVEGWWRSGTASDAATGSLVPLAPRRLVDTRTTSAVAAGASLPVAVLGTLGTSSHLHGVLAAVLAVTVVRSTASGYVTVRAPTDTGRPTTSSVNVAAGGQASNLVVAPVGDDGTVSVVNGGSTPVDVVVDITGYITR